MKKNERGHRSALPCFHPLLALRLSRDIQYNASQFLHVSPSGTITQFDFWTESFFVSLSLCLRVFLRTKKKRKKKTVLKISPFCSSRGKNM